MRITSTPVATGTSFAAMFFLGVGVAIVGATARAVGLSASHVGYLIAAQNVGFGIAVVVGGIVSDIFKKPVILCVGLVMLGVSFAVLYRTPSLAVNLATMLLMGLGMGSVEAVTDAWILEMHTKNEGRLITANHFFVTIGSVVITLYLMALELDWRSSLAQVAVMLGALSLLAAFLRPPGHVVASRERGRFRDLTADPGILLLFLAGVGSIGLGVGVAGVMTTFATELRGVSDDRAQLMLALLLIGMASGRVLVGVLDVGRRPGRIVALASLLALTASSVLFFVTAPALVLLVLSPLLGLSIGPLLPLTIAHAGLRHRKIAGTAMGVVKLAIPAGGIVVPGLVGLISDSGSFAAALSVFPASAILVLVSTILDGRLAARNRA